MNPTRKKLRDKNAALERSNQVLAEKLERAEERKNGLQRRLKAEYDRHMPKLSEDAIWHMMPGNQIGTIHFSCTAAGCSHYWPCPTWQTIREIYGWDSAQIRAVIERVDPTPSASLRARCRLWPRGCSTTPT